MYMEQYQREGDKYVRWILFNISQMVVKLGHQCPNHPVYNYYLKKKPKANTITKA